MRLGPTTSSSSDRPRRPACGGDDDAGVERGEHRESVAGRRGGAEIAPERAGVADLGGPDGARRLREAGQEVAELGSHELGVGDAGAEHDFAAFAPPSGELLTLRRHTTAGGRRWAKLTSTMKSVPPASSWASGYRSSASKASSKEPGEKDEPYRHKLPPRP